MTHSLKFLVGDWHGGDVSKLEGVSVSDEGFVLETDDVLGWLERNKLVGMVVPPGVKDNVGWVVYVSVLYNHFRQVG